MESKYKKEMIEHEDILKLGWKPWPGSLADDPVGIYYMGEDAARWTYKMERDGNYFDIYLHSGKKGDSEHSTTLFSGELDNVLELEHVLYWTGVKEKK